MIFNDQYISVCEINPIHNLSNMFFGALAMEERYVGISGYGVEPTIEFFGHVFTPTTSLQLNASVEYYSYGTDINNELSNNNKDEILASSGINNWNVSSITNMTYIFQGNT